jgi:hypothetical protein
VPSGRDTQAHLHHPGICGARRGGARLSVGPARAVSRMMLRTKLTIVGILYFVLAGAEAEAAIAETRALLGGGALLAAFLGVVPNARTEMGTINVAALVGNI